MTTERTLHLKVLALLAPAGALAGHCVGYMAAIPDAAERADVLAESGHAWLVHQVLAPLGAVLGLVAVFVLFARHLRDGPEAWRRRLDTCRWLAPRLAVVQLLVFYLIEVVERLVAGAPLTKLVSYGILEHGAAAQLALAAALTLGVWVLALAAERLRVPLLVWWTPPPAPSMVLASGPASPLRSHRPVRPLGARAPPRGPVFCR